MALESRQCTDRRVLFREPCTSQSVSSNSGTVTGGVTFNPGGIVSFDGTGNNSIIYNDASWAQSTKLSFRMKTANVDGSSYRVLWGTHYTDIEVQINSTTMKVYLGYANVAFWLSKAILHNIVDLTQPHEFVLTIDDDTLIVYADGAYQGTATYPTGWVRQANGTQWPPCLGIRNDLNTNPLIGDEELFEVYQGILTPEEVSLLSTDSLYRGPITENCVLFADYTRGTSLNWKDTDGIHTDTNTTYLHNIGLHCDTTTKVEYGTAYAIAGDWSLEMVVDRSSAPGLHYMVGVTGTDAGSIFLNLNNANRWGMWDGAALLYPEPIISQFNRQHLVITRSGTSYKFYRGGILVNTLVGVGLDITQITVGKRGDGFGSLAGNIAYLREYTGVLSAENVAQNHQYAVDNYGCE